MACLQNWKFQCPRQEAVIRQLYKELTHGKSVTHIEIHQQEKFNLVYLTGTLPNECREIFVPLITDQSFTMTKVNAIQEELLERHNSHKITMALIDEDSTTVYYSLAPGLIPPPEVISKREMSSKVKPV